MRLLRYIKVELKRLLQSPASWIACLIVILSPVVGLTVYQPASTATTLGTYLANPALAAGTVSAIVFGILTVYQQSRNQRKEAETLMRTIISPLTMAVGQILSLFLLALISCIATAALWIPYSKMICGSVFDFTTYFYCYAVFFFLAVPLGILFSSGAYQITRRFDLALVLFIAFSALSLTVWPGEWQMCWLNPAVWAVSDDFSNFRIFRSVGYMRLTWLIILLGVWMVSYLCIRRYGKGLPGSVLVNLQKAYRPAIAVLLLVCAGFLYTAQPFIDHSIELLDYDRFSNVEMIEGITYSGISAEVKPVLKSGKLYGKVKYQIQNTTKAEQEVQFTTNPGYEFSSVLANGEPVPYTVNHDDDFNVQSANVTLPAKENIELMIEYGGFPREWNLTGRMQGSTEMSPNYMNLQNTLLVPRPRNFIPLDPIEDNKLYITLPEQMKLIPFGPEEGTVLEHNQDGTVTWEVLSTYFYPDLFAGDYILEEVEAGGIIVEFYYGRKHQEIMKTTNVKEAIINAVEYCTQHFGPLSFSNNGRIKLIQERVASGGYAGYGASTLDEIDFTAKNLKQENKGSNGGEVMIHELVHQWWGRSNMFDPAAALPWSAEGLTVYTTYRIMKELYGEAYAKEHYIDKWQAELDEYYKNFYVRHPEYLEKLPEDIGIEIANSLSTVREYAEMPLKILKAEALVGGEEAFDHILQSLFNREIDPSYPYLSYQEFLDACGLSEEDLHLE